MINKIRKNIDHLQVNHSMRLLKNPSICHPERPPAKVGHGGRRAGSEGSQIL